jgi:phosphoketolase
VHLNRVIKKYDLDMIYVCGPGHGDPAVVGNTYLVSIRKPNSLKYLANS